jgi:hypothetical protein
MTKVTTKLEVTIPKVLAEEVPTDSEAPSAHSSADRSNPGDQLEFDWLACHPTAQKAPLGT